MSTYIYTWLRKWQYVQLSVILIMFFFKKKITYSIVTNLVTLSLNSHLQYLEFR